MQVIYEITAQVAPELLTQFESYLATKHIPEVLEAGGFERASFESSTSGRYRIRFVAPDRETLERYLEHHAKGLRADVSETFPAGLDIVREEWDVLATFPKVRKSSVA